MTNYCYGPCFSIIAIADHRRRCMWLSDVWCVCPHAPLPVVTWHLHRMGTVNDGKMWAQSALKAALDADEFPPPECKSWVRHARCGVGTVSHHGRILTACAPGPTSTPTVDSSSRRS
jgi:hypothetical protein